MNPHRGAAAERNLDWNRQHGLLEGPVDADVYRRWGVADLTARSFPEATLDQLVLATDLFGFYFLFDDQFDGALGLRPAAVAQACEPMIAIAHGDSRAAKESVLAAAFADLWERSSRSMSPRWRARAATDWEYYFAAHPSEALGRVLGSVPSRDAYLALRRGTGGTETVLDMLEVFAEEVPARAYHAPPLRILRQLAADIPTFSNDVESFDKEEPYGDVNNLVVVLQHERQCSRREAAAAVLAEAQWMVDHFARLVADVPALCAALRLDPHETRAVARYTTGLTDWLTGYLVWESTTARYHESGSAPDACTR
jgi:hypothetical protein